MSAAAEAAGVSTGSAAAAGDAGAAPALVEPSGALTPAGLAAYRRDGFLVLRGWWPPSVVATLLAATDAVLADVEPVAASLRAAAGGAGVFTTDEQQRADDRYFLDSATRVLPFLEPGGAAVNKVGHNLHALVPAFRAVSLGDARLRALAASLGFQRPVVPQSMLILKAAGVGGEVRPHVDGAFLHTSPQTVLGLWWPLQAATLANGCLWGVPGSHALGRPVRRFVRAGASGTAFDPADAAPLDVAGAVPLEMAPGDLLLIHAEVVHFSHANASPLGRAAYSVHVVDAAAEYDARNWLQNDPAGAPFPAL